MRRSAAASKLPNSITGDEVGRLICTQSILIFVADPPSSAILTENPPRSLGTYVCHERGEEFDVGRAS